MVATDKPISCAELPVRTSFLTAPQASCRVIQSTQAGSFTRLMASASSSASLCTLTQANPTLGISTLADRLQGLQSQARLSSLLSFLPFLWWISSPLTVPQELHLWP